MNMKKAIAILLVVLVAGVMFGANPTANLVIQTKLKGVEGIKLSTTALTKSTYGTEGADETLLFESVDEVTAPTAQTAYINLRTNKANAYTINLSGQALISETVDTTIGYVLTPVAGTGYTVGSTLTVAKGDTTEDITVDPFVTYTADSTSGLRVVPAKFRVLLTGIDWLAATAADDYTTTITVEVVAGS
ncbi:MAG: hypothetical protein WC239_09035 [Sphaerochaetaceae bacterium]